MPDDVGLPYPGVRIRHGANFVQFVGLVNDLAAIFEVVFSEDGKRVTSAKRRVRR